MDKGIVNMNGNFLVSKAHELVMARHDLSLEEQRVVLTLASMIQPGDKDFRIYTIRIKDFIQLLGVNDKSKYATVKKVTQGLIRKEFEIKQSNGGLLQVNWLSSAEYFEDQGIVELEISSKLKPYLLELHNFTQYRLKNVLALKKKYSVRLYEILKSMKFTKDYEITIEELRTILKTNKSYSLYQNFKSRILEPARKELTEKTDLSFEYEEIKIGKKVTSLRFYIKDNKVERGIEEACDLEPKTKNADEIVDEVLNILENKVSRNAAVKIYEASKGNLDIIKKVYEYSKTQQVIKSLPAYLIPLCKPGVFEEAVRVVGGKGSNLKFTDYEQRDYNYDALEKKLLGWEEDEAIDIEQHDGIEEDSTEDILAAYRKNNNV